MNEPPSFDPTDNMRSVAENTEPGQAIGDPVTAMDPDSGDTLTYLLGGPDAAAFDIDSTSGQLRTRDALDHEAKASYSVRMVALDTQGASASIEVTIEVTDANDPPSFDRRRQHAQRDREQPGRGRPSETPVAAMDSDSGDDPDSTVWRERMRQRLTSSRPAGSSGCHQRRPRPRGEGELPTVTVRGTGR